MAINKRYITAIKIIIALGVILYLIKYIGGIDKLLFTLNKSNYLLIIITLLLLPLNVLLQYIKWKFTVDHFVGKTNSKKAFLSLIYGFGAGIFTPVRAGEYVARAITYSDSSFSCIASITFIEKLYNLIIICFAGAISTILFVNFYYVHTYYLILPLLFLTLFFFLFLFYVICFNNSLFLYIVNYLGSTKLFKGKLHLIIELADKITPQYSIRMFIYSFCFYLCYVLQYALLVAAFSLNYNILLFLWGGSLVMFVKSLVPGITFGELGIRESASVFFISAFNQSSAAGFNASVFLFIINLLIPSLAGIFMLFIKDYNN